MELWNGYDKNRNERTRYDVNDARWVYYINDRGAIYYGDRDDPDADLRVWCPAPILTAHLVRLWQIKNRYK